MPFFCISSRSWNAINLKRLRKETWKIHRTRGRRWEHSSAVRQLQADDWRLPLPTRAELFRSRWSLPGVGDRSSAHRFHAAASVLSSMLQMAQLGMSSERGPESLCRGAAGWAAQGRDGMDREGMGWDRQCRGSGAGESHSPAARQHRDQASNAPAESSSTSQGIFS